MKIYLIDKTLIRLFCGAIFLWTYASASVELVSADIVPPNSHPSYRCVKIVNLDEFPNISLIGYYKPLVVMNEDVQIKNGEKYVSYQIRNNECLIKGYKLNTLSIYWINKSKSDVVEPNHLLIEDIEPYRLYADNEDPLIREEIEYSIAGFSDNKPVLYKSKQTSIFNDGTPQKVEVFNNPLGEVNVDKNNLKFRLEMYWHDLVCIIRELIGKSCL